ncbi:unnamed protein product, partial [Mesorhabditis spiculigera]
MKLLLLLAALFSLAACCKKFDTYAGLYCKFDKESTPCFQQGVDAEKKRCCDKGCNLSDFNKDRLCCFTQECLNRCYPGKGYKIGNVY